MEPESQSQNNSQNPLELARGNSMNLFQTAQNQNNRQETIPFPQLDISRKNSTNSFYSMVGQNQNSREDFFYKKVLPGLNAFAVMRADDDFCEELDPINAHYFDDDQNIGNDFGRFFNMVDRTEAMDEERQHGLKGTQNMQNIRDRFSIHAGSGAWSIPDSEFMNPPRDEHLRSLEQEQLNFEKQSQELLQDISLHLDQQISQVFSKKVMESLLSHSFNSRLENFLFVELQDKNLDGPFNKLKVEYFDMLWKLKGKLIDKGSIGSIAKIFVDFAVSSIRKIIKSVKTYDQRKMSNCLMQMASMDRKMIENFASSTNIPSSGYDKRKAEFLTLLELSDTRSNAKNSADFKTVLSYQTQPSDSNSKNSFKKRWSAQEEQQLMTLMMAYFPANVKKEDIDNFSKRWDRSSASVRSKIQKIRIEYQKSMESELDQITSTKPQENNSLREQEKILKKVLRTRAVDGITLEELRRFIPKQIIDDSQLAGHLKHLEEIRDILIKNEMTTELRRCTNLRDQHESYLCALGINLDVQSVYRIDDLFPPGSDQQLKKEFIREQWMSLKEEQRIYWIHNSG